DDTGDDGLEIVAEDGLGRVVGQHSLSRVRPGIIEGVAGPGNWSPRRCSGAGRETLASLDPDRDPFVVLLHLEDLAGIHRFQLPDRVLEMEVLDANPGLV